MVSGIIRGNRKNRTGEFQLLPENITLPSVKSWLAERLALLYHKTGSISPSRPTLAESEGVGLCLPQMYLNRMRCCLKPALTPHLLFFLSRFCPQKTSLSCTLFY